MKKKYLVLLVLIITAIPAIIPLFHKGFFVTDDGEWMIIRFSAFHQALSGGQFPVRFLPRLNFEYGYPVANFLYPGFMYLGEIFHFLKFGFIDTIKIIFGLSLISSSVFTYLWLSQTFKKIPSFAASLFFLYNPYHLFDIYRRGSLGEILALGIVPVIFWSIKTKKPAIYSLTIGLLILSHNTLAVLFLPIILIYLLLNNSKYFSFTLLGIGLSTFFWLPAIYDLQYTIFNKTNISDWQKYFSQLDQIGIANLIIFISSGFLLFINKKAKGSAFHKSSIFFFTITAVCLFFALPVSAPLWQILPVAFIQFPFRLLSVTLIGFSFLTAFLLNNFKIKNQILIGSILTITLLFFSSKYILNNQYFDKVDEYYSTNEATTTVKNEYMPKWIKELPSQRPQEKVKLTNGSLNNLVVKPSKILFNTNSPKKTQVNINIIYFPGWYAQIDGKQTKISYNNPQGLISFSVPAGNHNIVVKFTETPIRLLSDIISILSFLILILLTAKTLKSKEKLNSK